MATPAQAVPTAFVDWSRVTEIIDQAATGGITSIMLFQQDGALLASSRGASVNTVTGALITSIWQDHAAFCAGQEVQALLIDCSNGQVSVARVGAFLLCVVADIRTQPGIIRGKVRSRRFTGINALVSVVLGCIRILHLPIYAFIAVIPSSIFDSFLRVSLVSYQHASFCSYYRHFAFFPQMSALLAALQDLQRIFPQQM